MRRLGGATGTPQDTGTHRDTRPDTGGNRRTLVKRNIWLDFAQATEGSFLSPAHAASPRTHARNETISWSGLRSTSISPPNLRYGQWFWTQRGPGRVARDDGCALRSRGVHTGGWRIGDATVSRVHQRAVRSAGDAGHRLCLVTLQWCQWPLTSTM